MTGTTAQGSTLLSGKALNRMRCFSQSSVPCGTARRLRGAERNNLGPWTHPAARKERRVSPNREQDALLRTPRLFQQFPAGRSAKTTIAPRLASPRRRNKSRSFREISRKTRGERLARKRRKRTIGFLGANEPNRGERTRQRRIRVFETTRVEEDATRNRGRLRLVNYPFWTARKVRGNGESVARNSRKKDACKKVALKRGCFKRS